jgi:thioesterase domain-containing protein/acyl carrier protein
MDAKVLPPKKAAVTLPRLRRSDLPVRAKYVEPGKNLERPIAELWREILNVDVVGSQDDYFDLGGDSLMATELFLEIERWFGIRLADSEIMEHSTVAKLAVLLSSQSRSQTYRCLLTLQSEDIGPPLFLLHDVTGGVLSYRHMLRRLGRRKVFGLQYPGPVVGATSVMRFREMCAIYADTIRAACPQGPYYLAGYSLGAWIAFETANQLADAGGDVRLLVLIDGLTPHDHKVRGFQRVVRELSRTLFNLAEIRVGNWPGYLLGEIGRDAPKIWKWLRRQRQVGLSHFGDMLLAEGAAHSLPIYQGAVRLLRSTHGAQYFNHRKYLGWEKFVSGPLETFDITADHHNLMTEPRVALVAACLENWIREADTGRPNTALSS